MKDLIDALDDPKSQIVWLQAATDLRAVNSLLTELMGRQKIQALIKDENLAGVRDIVMDLALIGDGDDDENRLIGAAILGRLAAVARAREYVVYERLSELFEDAPLAIETLKDTDEKYYASLCISQIEAEWLIEYACAQAIELETAETRARRVCLSVVLRSTGNLSSFWQKMAAVLAPIKVIDKDEARYNRIRRITTEMLEAVKEWDGEVGDDAGLALADFGGRLLRHDGSNVSHQVVYDISDNLVAMLIRVVELRFSTALIAHTYSLLERVKQSLGKDLWRETINRPGRLNKIRICLLESALVLARQNRTPADMLRMLKVVYSREDQVTAAVKKHFVGADDIDPQTRSWWENAGSVKSSQRDVDQQIGNPEDRQIGVLILNVEESQHVMERLERAVVPFLEISEPPLAETVKKAADNYNEIAYATKSLAELRKLSRMNLKGKTIKYDKINHEMLGGHQLGVDDVKVQRDGITKDFNGKIKIFVKPRVKPAED